MDSCNMFYPEYRSIFTCISSASLPFYMLLQIKWLCGMQGLLSFAISSSKLPNANAQCWNSKFFALKFSLILSTKWLNELKSWRYQSRRAKMSSVHSDKRAKIWTHPKSLNLDLECPLNRSLHYRQIDCTIPRVNQNYLEEKATSAKANYTCRCPFFPRHLTSSGALGVNATIDHTQF